MAIGADYILAADLKSKYLDIGVDNYDELIASVVTSASREVERFCRRQFNLATTATARKVQPIRPGLCIVDDFTTTNYPLVLKTDDDGDGVFERTWTLGTDYELQPYDGVVEGVTGFPYWKVVAVGSYAFPCSRRASVQLTAQWGWDNVPAPVVEACKMVASDAFQYKDTRMGVAGFDAIGAVVRIRDNGMAGSKLKKYRRGAVLVA